MIDQITAISVSYKHKNLIETAVSSIKKFYPSLKFLIMDNSGENTECRNFVKNVLAKDPNIECIYSNTNVGHGRGMNTLLRQVTTDCAVIFDSDIEMKAPPIEEMYKLINNKYAVGRLMKVNLQGVKVVPTEPNGIPYLHPYFCLININQYKKFKPFFHHGAPCLAAMYDIYKQKKSDLLVEFPIAKYVKHDFGGTSRTEAKSGNPYFGVGSWDKI
jgi:hypothetical protein